jgi:hypothetical protein
MGVALFWLLFHGLSGSLFIYYARDWVDWAFGMVNLLFAGIWLIVLAYGYSESRERGKRSGRPLFVHYPPRFMTKEERDMVIRECIRTGEVRVGDMRDGQLHIRPVALDRKVKEYRLERGDGTVVFTTSPELYGDEWKRA